MHIPSHFKVEDPALIDDFIRQNSFGTLVSVGESYPLATHIPIELEVNAAGHQVLWGHISKANPQWRSFETNPMVLAIFLSPIDHYISSSWYFHDNVPTWNYMSVQVTGTLQLLTGEALEESLRRLMNKYESISAKPVDFDGLTASVKRQIHGIIGFEISIDRKEASFKLSQNRTLEDFNNVLVHLRATGDHTAMRMAQIMEEARPL